jgi:hypothetical protein
MLALALALPPGAAWAGPDAPAAIAAGAGSGAAVPARASPPLTDLQKQGYGCLIGASTVMALAGAAGAAEVVQVYTGGEVASASSLLLLVTLFVGVAATACSAASAATPAILHAWGYLNGYLQALPNQP